jgi:hypothetical protein
MRTSPLKFLAFALLPTLLLVLLAGAAAEITLRFRHDSTAAITGVTGWQLYASEDLVYAWDTYHPLLGWTNAPGYRSDERVPYSVTINGQGLRASREYAALPPPAQRRIAFFGDSMVFGEEVDDDQTVPFHLERALAQSEILNFGVHGYGLGQMALRLEEEGFAFEPDHVVIGYLTYDLLRDPLTQYVHAKPAFRVENGRLVVDNVPVPRDSGLAFWARHSFAGAWLWQRIERLRQRDSLDEALEVAAALLARIRAACVERDVPVTLVHLIDGYTLERMERSTDERLQVDRIRRKLAEAGIDFLDLADFLEDRHAEIGPSLLAPRGHWTGEGNRLIAEQIAAHLSR